MSPEDVSLVIMAAGQGSRFGGPKQFTEVGSNREFLMDYSIRYARKYGINHIYIITNINAASLLKEHLLKFHGSSNFELIFQDEFTSLLNSDQRIYGTGVALRAALTKVSGSFILVNGDDFYGEHAFEVVVNTLRLRNDIHGCLAGYTLGSTLSEHGTVSRAICSITTDNVLTQITEHLKLSGKPDAVISEANGDQFNGNEAVSMNFWGFKQEFCDFVIEQFKDYLTTPDLNSAKEFGIPDIVKNYIKTDEMKFLVCPLVVSEWAGLTYPEDLERVKTFLKYK